MNQDQFQGQWKQMKGNIRESFGKLTDDDVEQIAGKRDQLVGKLQERYGDSREEAERRVHDYEGTLRMAAPPSSGVKPSH
ncbi:MAG TPA: CsbD family protein [Gammaproteobacteria bacterium]|nr:CsbD family protein [Gammaproteobacteria bacterium]